MAEKLTIKNFGPIKDVTLDLRAVNVFIGDQGTGKSTVAKLYSLIENYVSTPILNIENSAIEKDENWQFNEYLKLFELKNYLTDKTEIFYKHGNHEVLYKQNNVSVNFIRERRGWVTYIVAERGFVSTLSDAFFGLNQFGTKLPTLFNRFGNRYATARKEKSRRSYKDILNIDFAHINRVDSIVFQDGNTIPLSDASSGLQGTIPLLVVYDSSIEHISSTSGASERNSLIVIEEPELNLFPCTQKKLLEYIIGNNRAAESKKGYSFSETRQQLKSRLLLTTHSPYILTSLNNLMYAYEAGKKYDKAVNDIIGRKYWMNPNDVSAYMMLPDGTCEDIMDREENLIRADKIDSVSSIINEEFNEIIDLEYNVNQ
jgi:predicted ATPase